MDIFDIVAGLSLIVVMALGYRAELLRSGLSILVYVAAMPIEIWATSLIAPKAATSLGQPLTQSPFIFFAAFVASGTILDICSGSRSTTRSAPTLNIADRLGGAVLGGLRVILNAVTLVLIFDRLIPADAQPPYLVESKLRPLLSVAAATGIKPLPRDVVSQIDGLKRERLI